MQTLAAWLGAFSGIALLVIAVERFPGLQLLLIGSFGASAVLLYGAPRAPFSQPRNLIGGHLISAVVGVACFRYLPDVLALQEATAVATAIALMMVTRTLHPPGGATALIAVVGSDAVHGLGWGYLFPVMVGSLLLLLVALISNNLFAPGTYPDRWD
jgi:CBS-domain-containing membrane protein